MSGTAVSVARREFDVLEERMEHHNLPLQGRPEPGTDLYFFSRGQLIIAKVNI